MSINQKVLKKVAYLFTVLFQMPLKKGALILKHRELTIISSNIVMSTQYCNKNAHAQRREQITFHL